MTTIQHRNGGDPRVAGVAELESEMAGLVRSDVRPARHGAPSPPPSEYVPPAHRAAAQEDEKRREFIRLLRSSPDPLGLIGTMFSGLDLDQWLEASTRLGDFLADPRMTTPEGRVFVLREWAKTLVVRPPEVPAGGGEPRGAVA